MTRLLVLAEPVSEHPGHPWWCPADHRCTARWSSGGEHTSVPEVWRTARGRVVATRHRQADGGAEHVEVRLVLSLPVDEGRAQELMRLLIAAGYAAVDDVLRQ